MGDDVETLVAMMSDFLADRTVGLGPIDPTVPLAHAGVDSISMSELMLEIEEGGFSVDSVVRSSGFQWAGLSLLSLAEMFVDARRRS